MKLVTVGRWRDSESNRTGIPSLWESSDPPVARQFPTDYNLPSPDIRFGASVRGPSSTIQIR